MNSEVLIKKCVVVALFVLSLFLFSICTIQDVTISFSLALILGLIASGYRKYYYIVCYFLMMLLLNFDVTSLMQYGCSSLILLFLVAFYHKKDKMNIYIGMLYFIVCELPYLYFEIFNNIAYLEVGINLILSLIVYVCVYVFFLNVKNKVSILKFAKTVVVCGCVLIVVLSSGIYNVKFEFFDFYHTVGIFLVLFSAYIFNKNFHIILSALFGLGVCLNSLDITYVGFFVICALVVSLFRGENKIFTVFSVLIADVLFGMYFKIFNDYSLVSIIETVFACLTFVLIPNSVLQNISGYFLLDEREISTRNIVNRNRNMLHNKLLELSNVFSEMDISFRKMIKGAMPLETVKEQLTNEAYHKSCYNCKDRLNCARIKNAVNESFHTLINIGLEKGKVSLLDLPGTLSNCCNKTPLVLSNINSLLMQYKQYKQIITNLDSSRLLIAEQLNGVAQILSNLGNDLNDSVVFDNIKERLLIDELAYNDLICSEALITRDKNCEQTITLLIRNQDVDNPNLKSIVSKVCKQKYEIKQVSPAEISGWSIMTLTICPQFDIVFGYACQKKFSEDVSGDDYSLLKLSDNKFLMAICDGMGSGKEANKASQLAISLIENFYKAGFDNDIILSSVNKLLLLNNDERFTALDICVIDLNNLFVDLIKLGAPVGFIKHKNTVTLVKTGSLPMGILDEMKPIIQKTVLESQDMIIICSDGVVDAFENEENLKNFINNERIIHPQILADNIIKQAIMLSKNCPKDDMTVLVGRVFEITN